LGSVWRRRVRVRRERDKGGLAPVDFTTCSEIILCEPEEEGLPCILIKAYGIGVISISLNPETKGSKRVEERFDGEIEEDWSNRIPLGNPSVDGKAGAE
jgi:hypothetical protein